MKLTIFKLGLILIGVGFVAGSISYVTYEFGRPISEPDVTIMVGSLSIGVLVVVIAILVKIIRVLRGKNHNCTICRTLCIM